MDLLKDPTTLFIFKLAITLGQAFKADTARAESIPLQVVHKMIVRFACPLEKRGDAEQEIYKSFW